MQQTKLLDLFPEGFLTDLVSLAGELLAVVVFNGLQVVKPLPQLLRLFPADQNQEANVVILLDE